MPPADPPPRLFYGDDDHVFALALHEPSGVLRVPERLIQDLWRTQQFRTVGLRTTGGRAVTVLAPGRHNHDTGPDFIGARLLFDGVEQTGDVEVHTTSGDWLAHRHHLDLRYNHVVLHVTLTADVWTGHLARADGTTLPEVVLHPLLPDAVQRLVYDYLTRGEDGPICASRWKEVPDGLRRDWISRLSRERLEARSHEETRHVRGEAALERALYMSLFAGLGYAKNTEAMRALASRVPLHQARACPDEHTREALFLGAAGLLPTPADLLRCDRATADYAVDLTDQWHRLRITQEVAPMAVEDWHFFRLRPANFPTLRIAQGASWFRSPEGLLANATLDRIWTALLDAHPVSAFRRLLETRPGSFWETHYRLDRTTRTRSPLLGRERVDDLILNAVAPVLLGLCDRREPSRRAQVFELVDALPHRPDAVTRRFVRLGTPPLNALQAQGYHQLYRTRCCEARCLDCDVGIHLVAGGVKNTPL